MSFSLAVDRVRAHFNEMPGLELTVPQTVRLVGFGVDKRDVSQFIMHQANGRILAQLASRLAIAPDSLCSVIERYGNTSSASLPIALDHYVRSGRVRPHDLIALGSFGGGLTWASGLIRW